MSDDRGRKTITDFLGDRAERLFHVGRLDYDTEGLMLLTNDGELAHRLAHPSYEVAKTYLADVPGPVPRDLGRRLPPGVELEDGVAVADKFRVLEQAGGRALVEITLHEGRKHIVRRMLAEVGHPVSRLVRTTVGPIKLGNLPPGSHQGPDHEGDRRAVRRRRPVARPSARRRPGNAVALRSRSLGVEHVTVRAIRGAIQVDADDRDAILEGTAELVTAVMSRNDLTPDDVISVLFTVTPDLTAEFPALAARKLGFHAVPLMCSTEIPVPGAMPRVVRLMAHVETEHDPRRDPARLPARRRRAPPGHRPVMSMPGRVLIAGTGLIGTSVALALRAKGAEVWLSDADAATAKLAADLGAGVVVPDLRDAKGIADVAVLAMPPAVVGQMLGYAQECAVAECTPTSPA